MDPHNIFLLVEILEQELYITERLDYQKNGLEPVEQAD